MVDGPRVKRARSGKCRADAPSSAEQESAKSSTVEEFYIGERAKVDEKPGSSEPASQPRSPLRLMRLPEPGASHPVVQLTGHLPGSRRIPPWMQVYSSVGRGLHQQQPSYASRDGKYLLYHSSGPGVGQGWWLGRADHGTESSAALAFLPSGHSEWWVLDKGIPQQSAQVIITNVWGDDARSLKPQPVTPPQQEADSCVGSSANASARSSPGLLRLPEPGAGHSTIQLTGHLPGECRIPAWMQVYNSSATIHPGHSTYASQDGKYLLYHSSGPGVAQGWWLGHVAAGISPRAALAFLPCGHDEWWVLERGVPLQAQVIISTQLSDKPLGQEQVKLPASKPPPVSKPSTALQSVAPAHAVILPIQQEQPPTTDSPGRKRHRGKQSEKLAHAAILPLQRAPAPTTEAPTKSCLRPRSPPLSPTEAPASTDLQPLSAPLLGKVSVDASAVARDLVAKVSKKSVSYCHSGDRIGSSTTRRTISTNSLVDRIVRDVDKDASDSIERIARAFSGSTGGSIEKMARPMKKIVVEKTVEKMSRSANSTDGKISPLGCPQPYLNTGSEIPVFALPICAEQEKSPDAETIAMTQRGGVCARELQLCIGPAEGGGFLEMADLKKQDRLLRSFEKMMLKMGSVAAM